MSTVRRDALAAWDSPDGYWTDELSQAVDECRTGERTTIPCPVCSVETHSLSLDTVTREFPNRPKGANLPVFLGEVATLEPCGHQLKRAGRRVANAPAAHPDYRKEWRP